MYPKSNIFQEDPSNIGSTQVRSYSGLYASSDSLNRHQMTQLDTLNRFTPDLNTNYIQYNRFYEGGDNEGRSNSNSEEPDILEKPDPNYLPSDLKNNDTNLSDDEIDVRSPVQCCVSPSEDSSQHVSQDANVKQAPLLGSSINLMGTLRNSYSESEDADGPSESLGFGLGFGLSREKGQLTTESLTNTCKELGNDITRIDEITDGLDDVCDQATDVTIVNSLEENVDTDTPDVALQNPTGDITFEVTGDVTGDFAPQDVTEDLTHRDVTEDLTPQDVAVDATSHDVNLLEIDKEESTDEDVRNIRRRVESMNVDMKKDSRFNINGEKKKLKKKRSNIFSRLVRSKSLTFDWNSEFDWNSNDVSPDALKRAASGELDVEYRKEVMKLEAAQQRGILKKERKKRKRLKLLSRAQRLRKKSSSKVSFDDYVTDCEYETDNDELGWIESPGYTVTNFPSFSDLRRDGSPDLTSDVDIEPDQEIRRLNYLEEDNQSSCKGGSVTTEFPPIPVILQSHYDGDVTNQHSFDWDIKEDDRTTVPEHCTDHNSSPRSSYILKGDYELIPLIMEVEFGAEMLDTKLDVVAVEMGVQTSVGQCDRTFGDTSIYDYSNTAFTGQHLKLESVSKGNKQSLKTIKKKRRLF